MMVLRSCMTLQIKWIDRSIYIYIYTVTYTVTTRIHRGLVYEEMQDLYHQQCQYYSPIFRKNVASYTSEYP